MISTYIKYKFSAISIKCKVAIRFREFSKQISKSHTEALEAMLNFFERNDLSPEDDLGIKNERTNKRINAVIAILKNIEKHQTKPTTVMLQSLLQETSKIEKEDEDDFDFGTPKLITENEELTFYKNAYYKTQEANRDLRTDTKELIRKVKFVRNNFGIGHYRLDITKEAFEQLKQKLESVHHHNTPETRR